MCRALFYFLAIWLACLRSGYAPNTLRTDLLKDLCSELGEGQKFWEEHFRDDPTLSAASSSHYGNAATQSFGNIQPHVAYRSDLIRPAFQSAPETAPYIAYHQPGRGAQAASSSSTPSWPQPWRSEAEQPTPGRVYPLSLQASHSRPLQSDPSAPLVLAFHGVADPLELNYEEANTVRGQISSLFENKRRSTKPVSLFPYRATSPLTKDLIREMFGSGNSYLFHVEPDLFVISAGSHINPLHFGIPPGWTITSNKKYLAYIWRRLSITPDTPDPRIFRIIALLESEIEVKTALIDHRRFKTSRTRLSPLDQRTIRNDSPLIEVQDR